MQIVWLILYATPFIFIFLKLPRRKCDRRFLLFLPRVASSLLPPLFTCFSCSVCGFLVISLFCAFLNVLFLSFLSFKHLMHTNHRSEHQRSNAVRKQKKILPFYDFFVIICMFLNAFQNLNIAPCQRTCLCCTLYLGPPCCVLGGNRLTLTKELCK